MKQWWQDRTTGERRIVLAAALVLLSIILYWNVWSPLQQHLQQQRGQVQQLQQQLSWMQQQAPLVRQLKQQSASPREYSGDIASTLSNSSQGYQIVLKRIQPQGTNALVEMDTTSFEQLVSWLNMLEQQYGITPQQIDLQPAEVPGKAQVRRLLLGRNPE